MYVLRPYSPYAGRIGLGLPQKGSPFKLILYASILSISLLCLLPLGQPMICGRLLLYCHYSCCQECYSLSPPLPPPYHFECVISWPTTITPVWDATRKCQNPPLYNRVALIVTSKVTPQSSTTWPYLFLKPAFIFLEAFFHAINTITIFKINLSIQTKFF